MQFEPRSREVVNQYEKKKSVIVAGTKTKRSRGYAWIKRVSTAWFKTYQCGLRQIAACLACLWEWGHAHAGTWHTLRVVLRPAISIQQGVGLE